MTTVPMHQASLQAGFARIDITPPVGIYHRMWGAARHDRATGVHRPLTATALALSSAHEDHPPRLLLALDHCLFWPKEMNTFLDGLVQLCCIPRERILVCFSHNLEKDERAVRKAIAFHQSLDKKDTEKPNWKLALEYGVILLSHAQTSQQIRQASELLDIAAKDSDSPNSAKIRAQWLRKLALRQLEFSQLLSSERALVGELKRKIEALSTIEQSLEERESKNEQ
jgi:hypothetical protein